MGFGLNIVHAYDFSAVAPSGQTLYYNIKSPTTVECVGPSGTSSSTWNGYIKPSGLLIIPSSVTYSGLSYTVNSIGRYAFAYCDALSSVTIPNSIIRVGSYAFFGDTALHTINLPMTGMTIGNCVFNSTGWYQDQADGLLIIGNTLVGYKGTIPSNYSLVVPSYIVNIAGGISNPSKSNIVSISLPSSVKYIGDYAFYNCNITSISFPSSLEGIGEWAFYGNLITSITIPSSVTYLGGAAFGQCGSLATVYYNAINATVLNEETIASFSPFYNCPSFSSLHIGSAVQKIPAYLFDGCSNILGSLSLPNSLNEIGDHAFYGCSNIQGTLSLPNSLLIIGDNAFSGCTGLTGGLILGNSVHTVGSYSFGGCTGISMVTIGIAVDSIASYAFNGMTSLSTINYNAINCRSAMFAFSSNTNVSNFNIGSTVQTIPDYLISSCPNITSVSFPSTLTKIGMSDFSSCGLIGAVILPASLTQIGYNAFSGCAGITSVQCNATIPPVVESYYGYYFVFSSNLTSPLYVPCSSISAYQSAAGWSNFTNILGIGGCNYTVTLSVNNPTMGTVSGGGTYTQGATATISATANSGYHFEHWGDGNTQNPRSLTVTSDISLTAYFEANPVTQYTITVNSNNATMGSASGGGTFNEGTTTTITATANSGYHFTQWQDGNTSNPRTITVTGNATYTAYFDGSNRIDDVETTDNLKAYTRGNTIVIDFSGQQAADSRQNVVVYDVMGRVIKQVADSGQQAAVEIPVTSAGVYMVKVGDQPSRKVVVRP